MDIICLVDELNKDDYNAVREIQYNTFENETINITLLTTFTNKENDDNDKYKYNDIMIYNRLKDKQPIPLCFYNKNDKIKFIKSLFNNIDKLEDNKKRFLELTQQPYRKFYFDLDFKNPNEYLTKEKLNEIINDIINTINQDYNLTININDVCKFVKKYNNEDDKFNSVHLIINHYVNDKLTLIHYKEHRKLLHKLYEKHNCIDKKPTGISQQLSMNKMGKTNNTFYSLETMDNEFDGLMENLENKPTNYIEYSEEQNEEQNENIILNINETNEITKEDCNEIITYNLYSIFDLMLSFKSDDNNLFNDTNFYINFLSTIINRLNTENLINNKRIQQSINNFLEKSAENTRWNKDDNFKLYNKLLDSYDYTKIYTFKYLFQQINNTLNKKIWFEKVRINNLVSEYEINKICEITNEEFDYVFNVINKNEITNENIIINKNYSLDLQKSLLIYIDDKDEKNNKNIFINMDMIDKLNIYKLSDCENVNSIEEVKPFVDNFINNENDQILIIKAPMGAGKTHNILMPCINEFEKQKFKQLSFSASNVLNKQNKNDIKNMGHKCLTHTEYKNNIKLNDYNIFCWSLESFFKINDKVNCDIVYIDEATKFLLNMYNDTTFNNKYKTENAYNDFIDTIKNAKKVLFCCADINDKIVKWIKQINKNVKNIVCVNVNEDKLFTDYQATILYYKSNLMNMFLSNVGKKNICLFSPVAKVINILENEIIKKKHNKVNILKVVGESGTKDSGFFVNGIKLSKEEQDKCLDDLIDIYKINILLYSPKISVGLSINKKDYFDIVFCYVGFNQISPREEQQRLKRIRNVKSKHYVICIDYTICNNFYVENINSFDDEFYKIYTQSLTLNYKDVNRKKNMNDDFFFLKSLMEVENDFTTKYYYGLFILLLKLNNINMTFLNDKKQESISCKYIENEIKKSNADLFKEIPYYRKGRFLQLDNNYKNDINLHSENYEITKNYTLQHNYLDNHYTNNNNNLSNNFWNNKLNTFLDTKQINILIKPKIQDKKQNEKAKKYNILG